MEIKQQISTMVESLLSVHQQNTEQQDRREINAEAYQEVLSDRKEVLDYLTDYAYFFPDWIKIINNGIFPEIERKQQLKIPYENETESLKNIVFFFSKIAYFNHVVSDWNLELDFIINQMNTIKEE
jgi:predicted O-linked N-acetylglucosamine transferase (SPINDLY family)